MRGLEWAWACGRGRCMRVGIGGASLHRSPPTFPLPAPLSRCVLFGLGLIAVASAEVERELRDVHGLVTPTGVSQPVKQLSTPTGSSRASSSLSDIAAEALGGNSAGGNSVGGNSASPAERPELNVGMASALPIPRSQCTFASPTGGASYAPDRGAATPQPGAVRTVSSTDEMRPPPVEIQPSDLAAESAGELSPTPVKASGTVTWEALAFFSAASLLEMSSPERPKPGGQMPAPNAMQFQARSDAVACKLGQWGGIQASLPPERRGACPLLYMDLAPSYIWTLPPPAPPVTHTSSQLALISHPPLFTFTGESGPEKLAFPLARPVAPQPPVAPQSRGASHHPPRPRSDSAAALAPVPGACAPCHAHVHVHVHVSYACACACAHVACVCNVCMRHVVCGPAIAQGPTSTSMPSSALPCRSRARLYIRP